MLARPWSRNVDYIAQTWRRNPQRHDVAAAFQTDLQPLSSS